MLSQQCHCVKFTCKHMHISHHTHAIRSPESQLSSSHSLHPKSNIVSISLARAFTPHATKLQLPTTFVCLFSRSPLSWYYFQFLKISTQARHHSRSTPPPTRSAPPRRNLTNLLAASPFLRVHRTHWAPLTASNPPFRLLFSTASTLSQTHAPSLCKRIARML